MNRERRGPTLSPETWPFEEELPNIVSFDEILGHRTSPPSSGSEEASADIPDGSPAPVPDDPSSGSTS